MLSIGLVRRASDAVRYYEKDDYYVNESSVARGEGQPSAEENHISDSGVGLPEAASRSGESQGVWSGSGARALGLESAVAKEAFQDVLDGRLPNGIALGRQLAGEWKHTPGWDLTFSAPKSVSILAEVAQDFRVHTAHDRAVSEALQWTERNAIGARVPSSAGSIFQRTGLMVAATFTHHTSRNQDPNLHTHAVIANATQTEEGRWRSVHSRELFNNKMAIGQIYRSALAREILALGYEIQLTHRDGRFEVKEVPGELVRAMSTRREQVEGKLAQWGASDAEAAARATLVTRPHKRDTPLSELISMWREDVESRGFKLGQLVSDAKERGPQIVTGRTEISTLLRESVQKLAEPEAVFRHGALVREVLQRTVGRLDVAQAEAALSSAMNGLPLRGADDAGVRLWTTTRAHVQEQRALGIAVGSDTVRPFLSTEQAKAILVDKPLTTGQRLAAETILTSSSPHMGVLGRPGTGKTTMLRAVRDQLSRQGVAVVGLAQNANAARNLGREAGIESFTVHKHLRMISDRLARASSSGALAKLLTQLDRREEVWIIDEASQLPNNLLSRLLLAADRLGARTVFVGDTRQLAAIEAGKPFELLLDRGMPFVEMDQILRQRNPADGALVGDAIAGRVAQALAKLEDRTVELKHPDDRLAAVVTRWAANRERRESTVVLTLSNSERLELNERMRDVLRAEGALVNEAERTVLEKAWGSRTDARDAAFYKPGQVVQFASDVAAINAKAGSYWTVTEVDSTRNELMLKSNQDGRRQMWNPREDGAREKFPPVIYERRATSLAAGETIRWARNDDDLKLANGQILRVESVSQHGARVIADDGRRIYISNDSQASQHWSHAYATTVYSAQGRTAEHAILHLNSQAGRLMTQHAFVVAMSRHRDSIALFTDSKARLAETLARNLGDKTSAVEALERSEATKLTRDFEREEERNTQHEMTSNRYPGEGKPLTPIMER